MSNPMYNQLLRMAVSATDQGVAAGHASEPSTETSKPPSSMEDLRWLKQVLDTFAEDEAKAVGMYAWQHRAHT